MIRDPRLARLAEIAAELEATMTDVSAGADFNTTVSGNGGPSQGVTAVTAAPGATGPLGQISPTGAVVTVIGSAAAGLLLLGVLFRRGGQKLPPLRVDAANALNVYFSWLLIDGTLKLVAYRYHGHKLAQQYLLIA